MLIKLAWRNIWRNRGRSIISITAVMFSIFFAIVMRSMQLGSYANIIDNVVGDYSGYVQIHEKGYWDEQTMDNTMEDSPELATTVLKTPGVKGIAKRLESFSLVSTGNTTKVMGVVGLDPQNELSGFNLLNKITKGEIFTNKDEGVLVSEGAAKYFKVNVGDSLVFIGQGYHGNSANGLFSVTGIVKLRNPEMNKNLIFIPLKQAQYLFAAENRVSSYVVEVEEGVNHVKLNEQLKAIIPSDKETMTYEEMMPELVQTIQADGAGGLVMIGVLYMIILFVLLGSVIMMTAERIKEYGILVAVGMHKTKLMATTLIESIFLALLGGILGLALARPIQYYYYKNPLQLGGEMKEVMEQYGWEAIMPTSIDWSIGFTHTAIIVCIAMVVSIYALVFIYKLKPVEAMRL